MPPNQPEFLPGTLYMIVLRTLAAGPMHGYAIAKRIKTASRETLEIEEGSLYPALRQLEQRGLISSQWEVQERGPARRVYALTEEGREACAEQRAEWRGLVRGVQAVLAVSPA